MNRPLRSLSWQTDLILLDRSIVTDRGDYLDVRTPERRGFYWVSFLLYREGPGPGDQERWASHFEREIASQQLTRYVAFCWDSPEGEHEAVETQVLLRDHRFSEEDYRAFCRGRGEDYRRIIGKGLGVWFGAFRGEELLGDLGIFGRDGVARYQWVQTHPGHRYRGVAGNLIHAAGKWGRDRLGATAFVIVTDPDSVAERLYRRCGFVSKEWQVTLEKGEG